MLHIVLFLFFSCDYRMYSIISVSYYDSAWIQYHFGILITTISILAPSPHLPHISTNILDAM